MENVRESLANAGFVICTSSTLPTVIRRIRQTLVEALDIIRIDLQDRDGLAAKSLPDLFERDRDVFRGLLLALSRTPDIYSLPSDATVLSVLRECGVRVPSLVTEPLFHVVDPRFDLGENKMRSPFHQDAVSTCGTVGQLVVWIPLHEITHAHPTLEVIRGSHLNGILPTRMDPFGLATQDSYLPAGERITLEVPLGGFVLMSQYLVHRTTDGVGDSNALHPSWPQRMAISFRVNDLGDGAWSGRAFFNPFYRVRVRDSDVLHSQMAPETSFGYFASLSGGTLKPDQWR